MPKERGRPSKTPRVAVRHAIPQALEEESLKKDDLLRMVKR